MSMVRIELEKYINPELTWKTVVKGNRSGSRRPRKPANSTLKPGAEWGRNNFKIPQEVSVSESEKHGVDVLGRRFSDKVEVIPIKKRRLMCRSPSPTPQSIAKDSGFIKFSHFLDNGKLRREDFSGIEILAAAACMNIMGDNFDNIEEVQVVDENLGQDGIDSSTSTTEIPLKNTIESLPNDLSLDYPSKNEKGSASCDDRSHWDLNTVMDAWEPICNDPIVKSQDNVLEGNSCEDKHIQNQNVENSEGCGVHEDAHMVAESRDKDKHRFETCSRFNETSLNGTFIPNLIDNVMKETSFTSADVERQDGVMANETNKIYDDYASRSGKIDLECLLNDNSCDSNVSQDNNHGHVVDLENEIKIQDGYDSQYEDGELRESNVYTERYRGENDLSGEYDVVQKNKYSFASTKMKISGWDQFPVSSSINEETDGVKFVEPRENQRQLVSYDDVPSSSDGFDRKDTRHKHRLTNLDDSYPHFERETEPDKFMRRGKFPWYIHGKSQGRGRWADHSTNDWDSKSRHTYRYYAPYDSDHPGPQKGAYGTNRYARGFGRGTRRSPNNGYNEPLSDHYLARREQRTFSPNHNNRGASHFSQIRKHYRSRSRSQERDVSVRHFRSRSPDFRFETRMNRDRFPIQKPTLASDYDTDFISPPRNRFSAKHNSRWIDYHEEDHHPVDHFRNRRSPVRMCNRRFDSEFDHGRFKSDGYFKPMMQQRERFDEMSRTHKYEGGDEYRRKYGGDKFETRPARHFDRDGFVRRARYDGENGFVSSHDIPNRKGREEKDQLRNNPDRTIYNSGPKTFELQKFNEDAS